VSRQNRYLIVGGWNVAFGYGLFLALLAMLGDGRFLAASWIAWLIAVPQDALVIDHFAYSDAIGPFPRVGRVYSMYLPAQVLNTGFLWAAVQLLAASPAAAALIAIAITVLLSWLAQTVFAFRVPLAVGEVRPPEYVRDYNIAGSLRVLWRRAILLARDVVFLAPSLVAARRRGTTPYVFAGSEYHHASAGIRAWHRIIHELNRRGMVAFSLEDTNPDWDERRITHLGYWIVRALEDPIVVYPEVVSGNPLRAGRVVRFVGNTPGYLGGDAEFADTELVFTWSKQFYDTDRILMVDTIESELFNDVDLPEKDTDCAYVGKAEFRGVEELPETFEMTHITRFPRWPSAREELAALLRRTRTLYTYDDCTMIIDEALLCGCEVVLLPEGRTLTEVDIAGRLTQQEYDAQMTRFIEETQQEWAT